MRIYEELFILRPDAPEEEIDQLIEQLTGIIAGSGGNVDKSEKWGVRKLAYRVQKRNEGFYVLLQFVAKPETVKEIERRLRVTDLVLKFLTVRVDEKMKKVAKRKKAREKRAARKPAPPSLAPSAPSAEHIMAAAEQGGPRPGAPMPGAPAPAPARAPVDKRRTSHQRIPETHRRRQGAGDQEAILPAQESVPVLRRTDRRYQLQGRASALVLHFRARKNRAAPHLGRLYAASEASQPSHQASAQHRADPVRDRDLRRPLAWKLS
jgi:small subunit ribosomal protein S6